MQPLSLSGLPMPPPPPVVAVSPPEEPRDRRLDCSKTALSSANAGLQPACYSKLRHLCTPCPVSGAAAVEGEGGLGSSERHREAD